MLIEMGGEALVTEGMKSRNVLHDALQYDVSFDVVSKLVEVGGKALVMEKNKSGWNSLHIALNKNASYDVILLLIEVGGDALVREKDQDGKTALHCACMRAVERVYNDAEDGLLEEALLNILTQYGGGEVLSQTDNFGKTALQHFIAIDDEQYDWWDQERKERYWKQMSEYAILLINKGIEAQIEGEYGIGGLFSSTQEVKERIYENWDNIIRPTLEQVMALPQGQHLPILQALVVNKAPSRIIKGTVHCFTESINTPDSFGRYPIDVGVHQGLAWHNGMKEVLEGSNVDILEREDASIGLYPFMVAALGNKDSSYDFDSVFHLIKLSPKLVQRFGNDNEEEQCSRKRKRS